MKMLSHFFFGLQFLYKRERARLGDCMTLTSSVVTRFLTAGIHLFRLTSSAYALRGDYYAFGREESSSYQCMFSKTPSAKGKRREVSFDF